MTDIHAADGDGAAAIRQFIQPVQKVHQGGFSAAGAAQYREGTSGRYGKGHILQNLRVRLLIGKAHMVEPDVPVHGRTDVVGPSMLFFRIQNIGHTVDGNAGLAHVGQYPSQTPDGPGEGGVVGDESHHAAQGHFPLHRQDGSQNQHRHDLDTGEKVARSPVDAH